MRVLCGCLAIFLQAIYLDASSYNDTIPCIQDWEVYGDHCVKLYLIEANFEQAQRKCFSVDARISSWRPFPNTTLTNGPTWLASKAETLDVYHQCFRDRRIYQPVPVASSSACESLLPQDFCTVMFPNNSIGGVYCNETNNVYCERPSCRNPLGCSSGAIPDSHFKAYSTYQSGSRTSSRFAAKFARLNQEFKPGSFGRGGWCSSDVTSEQFLQIDLPSIALVNGIEVQPVHDGQCNWYVNSFSLSYKRLSWSGYRTAMVDNSTIYSISNTNHTVHWLTPFTAKSVRIYPKQAGSSCSDFELRYCLRAELYGCYLPFGQTQKIFDQMKDFSKQPWPAFAKRNEDSQIPLAALLVHDRFCPDGSASAETYWHGGTDYNYSSSQTKTFVGSYEHHCPITNKLSSSGLVLATGSYCLLMVNQSCPDGFSEGYIDLPEINQFDQDILSYSLNIWLKYDVSYNQSSSDCCYTRKYYCCRNEPLCSMQPFDVGYGIAYPLANNVSCCPAVKGSSWTITERLFLVETNHTHADNFTFGSHPMVTLSSVQIDNTSVTTLKMSFCSYKANVIPNYILLLKNREKRTIFVNRMMPSTSIFGLFVNQSLLTQYVAYKYTARVQLIDPNTNNHISCLGVSEWIDFSNGIASLPVSICSDIPDGTTLELTVILPDSSLSPLVSRFTLFICQQLSVLAIIPHRYLNSLQFQNAIQSSINNTAHMYSKGNFSLSIHNYTTVSSLYRFLSDERAGNEQPSYHLVLAVNPESYLPVILSVGLSWHIPIIALSNNYSFVNANVNLNIANNNIVRVSPSVNSTGVGQFLRSIEVKSVLLIHASFASLPLATIHSILLDNVAIVDKIAILRSGERIITEEIKQRFSNDLRSLVLQYPKVTIVVVVDVSVASFVLTTAQILGITPKHGTNWIFIGTAHGILRHAFTSSECESRMPRCEDLFQGASVLYPATQRSLLNDFYQLSEFTSVDEFVTASAIDEILIRYTKSIIKQQSSNSTTFLASQLDLLLNNDPSYGNRFDWKLVKLFDQMDIVKFNQSNNHHCALQWYGNQCSIPYCSIASCKPDSGKCVAPGTCQCNYERFGTNCRRTCSPYCLSGECNDGRSGDGRCGQCDWLYTGESCEGSAIPKALAAATTGVCVAALVGFCYILKRLQMSHASMQEPSNESEEFLTWEEIENKEEQTFDSKHASTLLHEKLKTTKYFKGALRGQSVFIKARVKRPVKISVELRRELRKIRSFDHPNVQQVIGVIVGEPMVSLITMAANMGSLFDILHEEYLALPWEVRYAMTEGICRGMAYLHDEMNIVHGRLKSTNCLVHQGWLVKVADIGLRQIQQRNHTALTNGNVTDVDALAETESSDYHGLLWTAPEYLATGVTNLSQLHHITGEGDIYSFGIIMAEILTRRPPFSEITVMSVPHIVQAIGHLREAMVDLDYLQATGGKTDLAAQRSQLRPIVQNSHFPESEAERSILRVVMEGCWSEDLSERPPFFYIASVIGLLTPLKGNATEQRVMLLEKESESLERLISHDTHQMFREREKRYDMMTRLYPIHLIKDDLDVEEVGNVVLLYVRIANIDDILKASNATQAIALFDFIGRLYHVVVDESNGNDGNGVVFSSGEPTSMFFATNLDADSEEDNTMTLVRMAVKLKKAIDGFMITYDASLKVKVKTILHTGPAHCGWLHNSRTAPKYYISGMAVTNIKAIECAVAYGDVLITEACANGLDRKSSDLRLKDHSIVKATENNLIKVYRLVSHSN